MVIMKKLIVLIICILLFTDNSQAKKIDQNDLNLVLRYLNTLKTLTGGFKQSSDEYQATGEFLLKRRPNDKGSLKLVYDPPAVILMIAHKDTLVYYDKADDQVTYLDVEDTPLSFLLAPKVKIPTDHITSFYSDEKVIVINLQQPDQAEKLILTFNRKPFQLLKWTIIDSSNIITHVKLHDLKHDLTVRDKAFIFKRKRKTQTIHQNFD